MKVLKKRASLPVEASMSVWVGYDDDHIYTMGCGVRGNFNILFKNQSCLLPPIHTHIQARVFVHTYAILFLSNLCERITSTYLLINRLIG